MGQTTDKQKPINVRGNVDLITGRYENTDSLTPNDVGYRGVFTIDISSLAIENSVIDVDIWYQENTSAGGGLINFNHIKLPFSRYLADGTLRDNAFHNVYYTAFSDKSLDSSFFGGVNLQIEYYNIGSDAGGQIFWYKVTTRAILG